MDIVYVFYFVSTDDEHTIVALLAGNIFHAHVAHGRFKSAVASLSWLIVEVDLEYGFLTLSYGNLAHVDVLDESAAAVVGFDAEDALQMRRVHLAVFGVYILASA